MSCQGIHQKGVEKIKYKQDSGVLKKLSACGYLVKNIGTGGVQIAIIILEAVKNDILRPEA